MVKEKAKNIHWIYVITALGECYLTAGLWLFFYSKYLSFGEISVLLIMQQIVQLVLEIPTGAIADLLGKRKTLIVSYLFYATSLLLTPFFKSFWIFFVLEFIKGVAKALSSGTFEALTYDSLKENNEESLYPKVTANITTLSWTFYIIAGAIGGFLFDLSFYIPYIILGLFYVAALIIIVIKIKEPLIDSEHGSFSLKVYAKQTLTGFQELFANREIGVLVIFLLLGTIGYYTASEFLGIAQGKAYGLSASLVSLLFTIGSIGSAILAQSFTKIVGKVSAFTLAVGASLFMLISFLFAIFVSPSVGILLIMGRISSSSTFGNARSYLLNKTVSSKNRATALSTFSLLYTLPYVVITFIGGRYVENASVNFFAFVIGLLLTVGMVLSLTYRQLNQEETIYGGLQK